MNIEFLESEQAAYKMLDDFFAKNPECGDFQIDRLSGDILSPEALAVFRRSKEPHWQTYKEESRPKGSWYKAYRRYVEACIPSLQKAWLVEVRARMHSGHEDCLYKGTITECDMFLDSLWGDIKHTGADLLSRTSE